MDTQQRDRGGGDSGNAGGLPERPRLHAVELLAHLGGEPADRREVDSARKRGRFEAGASVGDRLLTSDVPGVFHVEDERAQQAPIAFVEDEADGLKLREPDLRTPQQVRSCGRLTECCDSESFQRGVGRRVRYEAECVHDLARPLQALRAIELSADIVWTQDAQVPGERAESLLGVVLPKEQAMLGARGEHPVGSPPTPRVTRSSIRTPM